MATTGKSDLASMQTVCFNCNSTLGKYERGGSGLSEAERGAG